MSSHYVYQKHNSKYGYGKRQGNQLEVPVAALPATAASRPALAGAAAAPGAASAAAASLLHEAL